MALSNTIIAAINFAAVLLSVPVIAAGVWLSTQADNACVKLIQWPIIVLGIVVLVVALAGFVGAFWRIPGLLLFYLAAMVMLILALAGLVVFIFVVTSGGGAHLAPSRMFLEYELDDYSGWLRRQVEGTERWNRIKACLSSTSTCSELNQTYNLAQDFFNAELSPLQSGCCKPPTRCGYTFVNPTYWISPIDTASDVDCVLWSNDQMQLCYSCSSCKAGLLANLRREWRRADLLLVAALIALITVYAMGCYAFRAAKTDDIFRRYKQGYT
ncbi:protein TORNADO 2 [Ananas comosus]|uniref:Protein TORNADO 2 n=1 Tax=Ananas comosus TaxID=4615 RepID=A0A199VZY8_ANACO|nr:protein TORNADO 2 [Ananas comosus]OAY82594.1 Protein TORNADO 2 [Ananas comosus]